MQVEREKLWEYDAVVIGQEGTLTHVPITADNIRAYALAVQNHHTRYVEPDMYTDYTQAVVAMPTMVLAYAPLLRYDIASTNGLVALEESETTRRQTPFAKCEIRWCQPVVAGDTIKATRRVLDKYERRGSKFVTFRVEAANQRGDTVAEYDYTCIFEYAKGRQEVPPAAPASETESLAVSLGGPVVETARRLTFEDVRIGDVLPGLRITETPETINRYNDLRLAGKPSSSNIHTDEAFARQNIFGGAVNAGPATMSYMDQVLQLSFPLRSFYNGGSLLMRAIEPFRAGDVVTMRAEVTDKRREGGQRLVTCRVQGINQRGDLVCLADATLNLPQ